MTHTFAVLEVSAATFHEIRQKLAEAGYAQAFGKTDGRLTIDMHGIGLQGLPLSDKPVHIEVGSIYGHDTARGLVELKIEGQMAQQMEPRKAIEIGTNMILAAEAAIGDEAHMRLMQDKVGLSREAAARFLLDLREFKQGSKGVVYPS